MADIVYEPLRGAPPPPATARASEEVPPPAGLFSASAWRKLGWFFWAATVAGVGAVMMVASNKGEGPDYWLVLAASLGLLLHLFVVLVLLLYDPERNWGPAALWDKADSWLGMFAVEVGMCAYGFAVNLLSSSLGVGSYFMVLFCTYCICIAQACSFPVVFGASSMWLGTTGGMVWSPGSKASLRDQIIITIIVIAGFLFRSGVSALKKAKEKRALERQRAEEEERQRAEQQERVRQAVEQREREVEAVLLQRIVDLEIELKEMHQVAG